MIFLAVTWPEAFQNVGMAVAAAFAFWALMKWM